MTDRELMKICDWHRVLKEVREEYPRRTIENIINNIEQRINYETTRRNNETHDRRCKNG